MVHAAACKKKESDPSQVVEVSFPVITLSNGGYLSIPVGSTLPGATAVGTAVDTYYHQNTNLVLIDSNVNASVPGLYVAIAQATNKYGFVSQSNYYVAVTNLSSPVPNIAGTYWMGATDSFNTTVSSIGSGYYSTSNVYGVNIISAPGTNTPNIFAYITDTTFAFTDANYGTTGTFGLAVGDTTMNYGGLTFTKH